MPQFKRATPAKKGDRPKTTKERVDQGFEVAEKGTKSWRDKHPTIGAMTESRGKKTEEARKKPKPAPKAPPKPKSKPSTPPKPKAKPAAKKVVRTAGGQRLKRDRFTGS